MVLTAEGRIFGWGRGSFGRLGTGLEKDFHSPVEIFLPGMALSQNDRLVSLLEKDFHCPVEIFLPGRALSQNDGLMPLHLFNTRCTAMCWPTHGGCSVA